MVEAVKKWRVLFFLFLISFFTDSARADVKTCLDLISYTQGSERLTKRLKYPFSTASFQQIDHLNPLPIVISDPDQQLPGRIRDYTGIHVTEESLENLPYGKHLVLIAIYNNQSVRVFTTPEIHPTNPSESGQSDKPFVGSHLGLWQAALKRANYSTLLGHEQHTETNSKADSNVNVSVLMAGELWITTNNHLAEVIYLRSSTFPSLHHYLFTDQQTDAASIIQSLTMGQRYQLRDEELLRLKIATEILIARGLKLSPIFTLRTFIDHPHRSPYHVRINQNETFTSEMMNYRINQIAIISNPHLLKIKEIFIEFYSLLLNSAPPDVKGPKSWNHYLTNLLIRRSPPKTIPMTNQFTKQIKNSAALVASLITSTQKFELDAILLRYRYYPVVNLNALLILLNYWSSMRDNPFTKEQRNQWKLFIVKINLLQKEIKDSTIYH